MSRSATSSSRSRSGVERSRTRRFPDELVADVVQLRRLFDQTINLFDQATNPLLSRGGNAGGFGRKAANQSFGRI